MTKVAGLVYKFVSTKLVFLFVINAVALDKKNTKLVTLEKNDLLQCARDICGPEEYLLYFYGSGDFNKTEDLETKLLLDTNIMPKVETVFNLWQKELNAKKQYLDGALKGTHNLSQQQTAIAVVATMLNFISHPKAQVYLKNVKLSNYETIVLSDEGQKKLPKEVKLVFQKSIPVLLKLLSSREFKQSAESFGNDTDFDSLFVLITNTYPEKNKSYPEWENIVSGALVYLNLYKNTLSVNGLSEKVIESVLAKGMNPTSLSAFEKKIFVRALKALYGQEFFYSPEFKVAYEAANINSNDLYVMYKFLAESIDKDSQPTKEDLADLTNACRKNIATRLYVSPSQLKLKHFQNIYDRVGALAKEYILDTTAPNSDQEQALKKLEERSYLIKDTVENQYEHVLASLNSQQENISENLNALKIKGNDPNILFKNLISQLFREKSPADFLDQLCRDQTISVVHDGTYHNFFVIGWQTLRFHEYTIGILAHEFGHAISLALSQTGLKSQHYSEVKLKGLNPHNFLMQKLGSKIEPRLHAEEDWADYFATKVIQKLKARSFSKALHTKNYGCALMMMKNTGNTYSTGLVQPEPAKHSTDFYRTLRLEKLINGKVPQSCEKALPQGFLDTF